MLERQGAILHARLAAEIAIGSATDPVEDTVFVQGWIGIEAEVAIHQPETALARHETAHDGPGHGRRLGQDLGEVVAAPNGASLFRSGFQDRDFLPANLLQFL